MLERTATAPPRRRARGAAALAMAAATTCALVLAAVAAATGSSASLGAAGPDGPVATERGTGAAFSRDGETRRGFVTREGRSLLLDGTTYRFTGFNLYNAAASDAYSCPGAVRLDDAELDAAMRQVRRAGGSVVRVWAFQSYTRGGTDYSGLDRVLASARAHGLKVFPVLENQWRDCSRPQVGPLSEVQNGTWFTAGYRAPLPGQPLSFRDYARRITHHYRDDPTVFAWSLLNEAETRPTDSGGESELVGFARDMSAVVHEADPHHLLTLGTQSNGAPGASGADFHDVYGLPGLDFAEVHDWADRGSDDLALPGAPTGGLLPATATCRSPAASLACSFALSQELGKPIVVGEAGIAADGAAARETRARQLRAKLEAAFEAGASGYLVWQLNTQDTDGYGVIVGADDPVFSVLREALPRRP